MSTVIQASTEIDLEDAAAARKQRTETRAKESDRELVARLVDQARAEGVELVDENGLLGRLTKLVLESAPEGDNRRRPQRACARFGWGPASTKR